MHISLVHVYMYVVLFLFLFLMYSHQPSIGIIFIFMCLLYVNALNYNSEVWGRHNPPSPRSSYHTISNFTHRISTHLSNGSSIVAQDSANKGVIPTYLPTMCWWQRWESRVVYSMMLGLIIFMLHYEISNYWTPILLGSYTLAQSKINTLLIEFHSIY